jgi:hypothetical protein
MQEVGIWLHIEKGYRVRGTIMISVKRGSQWNRSLIRVAGREGGSTRNIRLMSDGYHCDQCEEGNLVG